MNFLISILSFILGWVLGIFTRNILMSIINVNKKIKMAERIIAEEQKRKEFKQKYDFDLDDDSEEN